MARRAVQSLAVKNGAPRLDEKSRRPLDLAKQIAWLADKHLITPQLRTAADAVRWLGNHGAHENEPDVDDNGEPYVTDVDQEDARQAIEMAEEICRALYVPAALAQLSKRGMDAQGKRQKKPPKPEEG